MTKHRNVNGGGGGLVAKSCPTLATPWTIAHQAPLSRVFPCKNTGVGCHFLLQKCECSIKDWEIVKF